MSFGVSKINGTLLFKDFGGYENRNPSTFWCIQQADKKYKFNDFNEIKIDTNDNYDGEGCSYSKENSYNKLVPDFNFHSWRETGINDYELFVNSISDAGLSNYQINKVGWIGAMTNFRRNQMLQIGNNNKELFDFLKMDWLGTYEGTVRLNSTKYISTPDLVKQYSMLIDIEGNGYSGRLKHLLWSHRPVLIVDRPAKEYFFEFLKEWEHYIPVKRDLSDLIEKTKWCLDNYDKALKIAENAYQFSKLHLTRDACYDKWKDIITTHQ